MSAETSGVNVERARLSGRWTVRPEASSASFSVRDKLVTTVHGSLPVVTGQVEVAPDGTVLTAYVEVSVAGIATGNDRRDKDLRKPQVLHAQTHPTVRVHVTDVTTTSDGWTAQALVDARGRSAPVTLTVQPADDPEQELTVRVTGQLDRAPLGIRAPTFIIGRFVNLNVTLALHR